MVQGGIFGIWIVLCIFVKFIASFIVSIRRPKGFIALSLLLKSSLYFGWNVPSYAGLDGHDFNLT